MTKIAILGGGSWGTALAIVFSRLIDNSVIVLENIFRHMELGEPPEVAAEKGGQEVGMAVLAATIARPIPVFPLVGSTIVPPGFSLPCRSAASIMLKPILSLTLPPGLKDSSFTRTSAQPSLGIRFRRTTGVLPIS